MKPQPPPPPPLPKWLAAAADGCVVTVKATPRAARSEISGADADWLRVRLHAPPVDGKANAALAELLARALGLAARDVDLLSGGGSRLKRLRLRGVTPARARDVLAPPAPASPV